MDKGAHFYKCDFQVHTPRDLNWKGAGAATPADRQTYAEEFVAACRQRELTAVAITDHHDLAFFPFIKQVADAETDATGQPLPPEQRLVVFPGMELTLGVPCQALLLFDADFPVNLLPTVLTALAISQTDAAVEKHGDIQRLEHIKNLQDLYDTLNLHQHLAGHFIVLPHVGESGNFSLLRKGFATHYKTMPCVGGFVDGSLDQHGDGNKVIVAGKNREWGLKRIGLFQTSDNRHRDFRQLGKDHTWVKWATPTAEAIRQACLAQDSRIAQTEPQLPSIFVTSVEVSNSKFMGPVTLEFNPQYNAFIGGRGTGKSTVMEYLRWALCDQPARPDDGELPDFQKRRRDLVEKTLLPLDGSVQVSFLLNKIPHTVRRYTKSGEILLRIGQEEFRLCTEAEIRSLLPIHAYSQKQLSSVGTKLDELKRFIHAPIKQQLDSIASRSKELNAQIRRIYESIHRKRELEVETDKYRLELRSIAEQVTKLRADLKGVSPDDQRTIALQDKYAEEERFVDTWLQEVRAAKASLGELAQKAAAYPTAAATDGLPNAGLISKMQDDLRSAFSLVNSSLKQLIDAFDSKSEHFRLKGFLDAHGEWKIEREKNARLYAEAKARSTSHEAVLKQIDQLEARSRQLRELLAEKERNLADIGKPADEYVRLRTDWLALQEDRRALLAAQCTELTALSRDFIKATLLVGAGTAPFENALKEIIKGSKIRGEKIEALLQAVRSSTEPRREWEKVLLELEKLAALDAQTAPTAVLPDTPMIAVAGFTEADRRKVAERLTVKSWLDLSLMELEDVPEFKYRSRPSEYIDFVDASAGQQATSLMYVLLNQAGPPLIIDQPEDDLDNNVIKEIVEEIWKAKGRRQLIFSSHNANLVVNGDAELVICCDYRVAGDQSGGKISSQGAIDVEEIRREITNVMEGGKEAFTLRKEKYGF